ncbi:MAG: histidine--tRNA ligase [Roseinatronobacter sp.]
MSSPKAPRRPKAETPKGFRDYFGPEVTTRKAMLDKIAAVYHRYGFDALETSAVETVEALGKFLPDVDRPNEGVFAWQEDVDWLALRYDLTAPLARVAAQYRRGAPSSGWPTMPKGYEDGVPMPYRRYAMGPVWRNEKPGPGRFRQFYQCDADTVGAASVAADAEICAMLADALEEVGIPRGDYVIRVNNRKVLNGVMEVAGLSGDDKEAERGIVLRAIDKLDRLGVEGVRALLGEGRKDESGDFTKGAGLDSTQAESVLSFVMAQDKVIDRIEKEMDGHLNNLAPEYQALLRLWSVERGPDSKRGLKHTNESGRAFVARLLGFLNELVGASEVGRQGVQELREIAELLGAQGYGADRIIIDPSVVRGLGYYTGPVFEAELTFQILDEKGRPRQFGSVAGGGRYDDLVKRFNGQPVPATGVSIGVDRLLAALAAKGRIDTSAQGPVVVTVMDRERMSDYMGIVAELRENGIRAEVYLGNPKNFGNQLKYADKRQSPIAIIQGSDEAARGVVQVKDLILGAKIAAQASVEEWKSQPAQMEVARADLIATVRAILARHA